MKKLWVVDSFKVFLNKSVLFTDKELQVQKWVNDIRVHANGNNNGNHGNNAHNNGNNGNCSHGNSWEDKEDVEGIMEILVKYKAVLPNQKQALDKVSITFVWKKYV